MAQMIQPSPIRAGETANADTVAARRRVDCRRAGACLSIAHRARWDAYQCPREAACYVRPSTLDLIADEGPLLELLGAALRVRRGRGPVLNRSWRLD